MKYRGVAERNREELELLLQSGEKPDILDALLSAAFYDPDWRWVQGKCLIFSHHSDHNVRWVAATCLGHLARIHRQLDLEPVLKRLSELKKDPLVRPYAQDALDDIGFYLKFQ